MNKSIVEVTFNVIAKIDVGEEIRLSGNVPAFGCDDPAQSLPLVTSPTLYPTWKTKTGNYPYCYTYVNISTLHLY